MSRKKFGQLLQKYLRGECTPAEKAFVDHWYGLLETGETEQNLDTEALEDRLWKQIQQKKYTGPKAEPGRVIPFRNTHFRWVGVAATLLLIGWWYVGQRQELRLNDSDITLDQTGWIERQNTTVQPLSIQLEDGSTVKLAAHSSLRFPKHFTKENRTVYLTGDAFFSVAKMPSRPFYVHTGRVVTKVLGTSFFVKSQSLDKQVRVEVVTGRVAVYEQTAHKKTTTNGVVLKPNQTATYFVGAQHFVTGLVEKPQVVTNPQKDQKPLSFQFDDAPLSEVLEKLEQAYGINIEVESESQNDCPLTADLTDQPLYTQLDIICAALKAKYEVQGTTILLTGKGCSN